MATTDKGWSVNQSGHLIRNRESVKLNTIQACLGDSKQYHLTRNRGLKKNKATYRMHLVTCIGCWQGNGNGDWLSISMTSFFSSSFACMQCREAALMRNSRWFFFVVSISAVRRKFQILSCFVIVLPRCHENQMHILAQTSGIRCTFEIN